MRQMAERARGAARELAALSGDERAGLLRGMAAGIDAGTSDILLANAQDIEDAKAAGLSGALVDRLLLTEERVRAMAAGVREVAAQRDPLEEVLEEFTRPNGLVMRKVRAALGVIVVVYESRPNVTADAAAICLKAGSAVILLGGKESLRSNHAILAAMRGALEAVPDAAQMVESSDREAVHALLRMDDVVDLVVPRGGEELIRAVAEHARVPVLKHYKGVCHVYVDGAADLEMALQIAVNAKCQRPGVCNAMETLLVAEGVAGAFLPRVGRALRERGVELRADARAKALLPDAIAASEEDWSTEYLDLILTVGVVDDVGAAIAHINRYGSNHSDVIVTRDEAAAARFTREVDSAVVYVNASSRFTDGAEFGKGAEIGISTGKLHARGPCGVEELTTYKYVVTGSGQVRT
ncbi:MAG: glutamate-5-semialdehyde dehydrogenase [Planctomycetota bacterium]|nr:glutamate-5-semialdehyde dehydrogenase [Planctomycetota bacterium]